MNDSEEKKGDEMKQAISKDKAAAALKQEELGVPLEEIIREMGVTRETYLGWRRGYHGLAASAGLPVAEQPPDCDTQTTRVKKDEK